MVFKDEYDFLSNFYLSPFTVNELEYKTVEHFFQSYKPLDIYEREIIRKCKDPQTAKKLGRTYTLRPEWKRIKYSVMMTGVINKFKNPELKEKLFSIPKNVEIIEHNYWHDNFWGYCVCPKCADKEHLNNLGKILMLIKNGNILS